MTENKDTQENEKGLKVADIVTDLLSNLNYKFYIYNNSLYYYSNKKVFTNNYDELNHIIVMKNEKCNSAFRDEIKERIKYNFSYNHSNYIESVNSDFINFQNGLYHLESKKLTPHNYGVFTINQMNVPYYSLKEFNSIMEAEIEVKASVECIEKFLNDISCNNQNRKKAILEMIGYCMTSRINLQKAFMLYGKGSNGKSTLADLIKDTIGKENCENLGLDTISNDKFGMSRIQGKIINVSDEMTSKYLDDSSPIKILITNDEYFTQAKYKDGGSVKNQCKFVFNINTFPKISDNSVGFYRRWHVIPFEATFDSTKDELDKNLLFSKWARSYLATISLNAYLDMISNNRYFSNKEESDNIIELYKQENDSIEAYIHDIDTGLMAFCENAINVKVEKRSTLYEDYKAYCSKYRGSNGKAKGKNTLYEVLRSKPFYSESKSGAIQFSIDKKKLQEYLKQ